MMEGDTVVIGRDKVVIGRIPPTKENPDLKHVLCNCLLAFTSTSVPSIC